MFESFVNSEEYQTLSQILANTVKGLRALLIQKSIKRMMHSQRYVVSLRALLIQKSIKQRIEETMLNVRLRALLIQKSIKRLTLG